MYDSGYYSCPDTVLSERGLLFGEIDTASCAGAKSLNTNNSICNLILSSSSNFLRFWLSDGVREAFLECIDPDDLASLRLICHDFSHKISPRLFSNLKAKFAASTLTRPSRIAALRRIGHHVDSLELTFPRTTETALPPLINIFGEEIRFVYKPQVSGNAPAAAKYGSNETADLLIKQYPPVFHSATNVVAFRRALDALPNLRQLRVSCPNEGIAEGVRTTADYALISLRIAIERASLPRLESLSFSPIYPTGLFYMQPVHGIGGTPSSGRRWAQIRHLSIDMESSGATNPWRADQLKTLHNYLRVFATSLTSFHFRWQGDKGPSPMSLDTEPGIFKFRESEPSRPRAGTAIRFTALNQLNVQNAEVDASQISAFISQHRRTLEEFKFESIKLRTGDWDEALSPLAKWRRSFRQAPKMADEMEVPLILSPVNLKTPMVNIREAIAQQPATQARDRNSALHKWLTRTKVNRAKEQIRGGSEQMRLFLRRSIPWT